MEKFQINISCLILYHTKYVLMIGKHQESSYCDEARLTSKYYFF